MSFGKPRRSRPNFKNDFQKLILLISKKFMATIKLTDADFEANVIEKSKEVPVLVDFWAPWCGPCQMLGPILEDLSNEMGDKVVVAKLNVDENNQKAGEYQIMSIPAMKLFKDGKVIEEFVGVTPKEMIKEIIEKHL